MAGIVVGLDSSQFSEHALEWALKEAAVHDSPLTVITVHPVAISTWTRSPIIYPQDAPAEEQARQAAQEVVDKAAARLGEGRPASVTVRAVSGLPAEALINASAEADLLVVGSRGAGGFARLLMGSVSSQVAYHAVCPVVIVRAPASG